MTPAVSGYGNTAHSAAQPLRLWFGLSVATSQASMEDAFAAGLAVVIIVVSGMAKGCNDSDNAELRDTKWNDY